MKTTKQRGFTLVEMMVALVVSAIVIAAIYSTYVVQNVVAIRQSQVADIQGNLRAVAYSITRELRMAGFNPNEKSGEMPTLIALGSNEIPEATNVMGILIAEPARIAFSMDNAGKSIQVPDPEDSTKEIELVVGDGDIDDPSEIVTYSYDKDKGIIYRATGKDLTLRQPMVQGGDIAGLEFLYFIDDGKNGKLTCKPTAAELKNIRSVTVSLLGVAHKDPDYKDTSLASRYVPCSQDPKCLPRNSKNKSPSKDLPGRSDLTDLWPEETEFDDTNGDLYHQRKRLLVTNIQCRNIGI